jgi:hypothetical protein
MVIPGLHRNVMLAVRELAVLLAVTGTAWGQHQIAPPSSTSPTADVTSLLEERVKLRPKDSAAWRLLGRARIEAEQWHAAREALITALRLDPLSVAAYYDFGCVARHMQDHELAAQALARAIEIAPESEYAELARTALKEMEEAGSIEPASYEIRSFDGSNLLPLITGPEEPFWKGVKDDFLIRIDLGAQYNDNVTLAPSSRELQTSADHNSAQGTASLTAQWYAVNTPTWRFGPTLDVDYTLNEHQLDRFNLQSYRPGVFTDGTIEVGDIKLRPRVAYAFTHDEFNGSTFGNRHNLAASLGAVWTKSQITTLYYSIDDNNVLNNGTDPSITSQDGVANTIGAVHDILNRTEGVIFRQFRFGSDFSNVDTVGSNYRFRGVSIYTQGVWVLRPKLNLTVRGGWAHREYYDYTFTPSRNTNIWRLGGELRKYFDMGFSAALVAQYDRFESKNAQFNTDRFLTGGVATWEF